MSTSQDQDDARVIRKPELLDEVVLRTGLRKRDIKPAVEAALSVLGDALRDGTEINVPPLGRLRVVKSKELEGGAAVMTLKLRTPKHVARAAALAEDDA